MSSGLSEEGKVNLARVVAECKGLPASNDVHAWSPALAELAGAVLRRSPELAEPMPAAEVVSLFDRLRHEFGDNPGLSNTRNRVADGALRDPDLGTRLNLLWMLQAFPAEWSPGLRETLTEIGSTCLQGVTHRILLLWIAFMHSSLSSTPLLDAPPPS